ncbi:hypothetical protein HFN_1836 [Helicobacter fennelliae MRY12-0050]|uniref:Uncharacterized protein n=1 Tax=Helicobacter fennelliae MRY12-0050 TaxID=1325130 RepID=T1DUV6_9HELI|nr:hypothetical protein HFN_1836 [Helicobacter fennelliae MRY12-0050]
MVSSCVIFATHNIMRLTLVYLAPNSQNYKNKLKIENFLHALFVFA